MTEAENFRHYAKEAMQRSSKIKDETEKQTLIDVALTWTRAAMASDRIFGSSFTPSPRDPDEATPLTGS